MSPLFVAVRRAALLCLPFAAVFAVGVTLSPHASADYPGGGGYPGGGWSVLYPDYSLGGPGLATPDDFQAADWSPPFVHFSGVYGPPDYRSL